MKFNYDPTLDVPDTPDSGNEIRDSAPPEQEFPNLDKMSKEDLSAYFAATSYDELVRRHGNVVWMNIAENEVSGDYVVDAGPRYEFESLDPKGEAGAAKVPLWLVPPAATKATAEVLAHGAQKYGAFNWRATRVCASTYISALLRHFDSWRDGEDNDPDSGLSHLAHVAANVNILLDAAACGVLQDDRFKKPL